MEELEYKKNILLKVYANVLRMAIIKVIEEVYFLIACLQEAIRQHIFRMHSDLSVTHLAWICH